MKKILIIKFSALGDLFMALPHMDVILARYPHDPVWVLTGPDYVPIFAHHPRIQTVALDRSNWFGAESSWGRMIWIRREGFSDVYDLQGNRISRQMVRFSGAPTRVGTQPNGIYTHHPSSAYLQTTPQNVFDRLNDTLLSAGLPRAAPGCRLYPSEADREAVAQWKHREGLTHIPYAVMHAGSSSAWPSKRWPADHFLKLGELFEAEGIRCVWIGGEDDRAVNFRLAQAAGIDATGRFSLLQLYVLGKGAAVAVTNDSGPMHVLAASGGPVYSFFGPTSWLRSHAAGQKHRVIFQDIDCSPCFCGNCPEGKHHQCLAPIQPDKVFLRIKREMGPVFRGNR